MKTAAAMTTTAATFAPMTYRCKVHFHVAEKGKVELRRGAAPAAAQMPQGRVPKLSRLMALAIRLQGMLDRGEVKDMAELARLGHVTRARMTQIMNLLCLAPDLQEQILFMPPVEKGYDPLKEWQVRPIAAEPLWSKQRRMWLSLPGDEARRKRAH
jgi:hypothetical protein